MKRSTIVFCGLAALLIAAIGCSDVKRTPGKVYMPDMANSRAYETYSANPVFADVADEIKVLIEQKKPKESV